MLAADVFLLLCRLLVLWKRARWPGDNACFRHHLRACCLAWNEPLHLFEPQFAICKIGIISAMVAVRTKEDTLRAPSLMLSLILFLDLRGARCGVGQSVPRVVSCTQKWVPSWRKQEQCDYHRTKMSAENVWPRTDSGLISLQYKSSLEFVRKHQCPNMEMSKGHK